MIKTRKALREILTYERQLYISPFLIRRVLDYVTHSPKTRIWRWQKASRKADYYKYIKDHNANIFGKLAYVYYISKRNRIGEKLGLEVETMGIAKGLLIYHYGGSVVLSCEVTVGENCRLHGNNCIGNGGPDNHNCPVLGNNVMVGVGAKIVGGVRIADNVKIGAGAVVVTDILEPGCTVVGVPGKVVKRTEITKR